MKENYKRYENQLELMFKKSANLFATLFTKKSFQMGRECGAS
jgi:hypothetical protein